MTYSSYRVTVPGKLVIAGEYAVLENQQAVVAAIDRYMTATIEPNEINVLSLPLLGLGQVSWDISGKTVLFSLPDPRLRFIKNAITIAYQYLQEQSVSIKPCHLTVKSGLADRLTGRKYGLGSSAAVVVAVISAILRFHCEREEEAPSLDQIFKLSAMAHLQAQKNGSGVDIAASTYGGWLVYTPFNQNWLRNELLHGTKLSQLIEKPWPNLSIIPIKAPLQLTFCVGWTKEAASTAPMINQFKAFRNRNREAYSLFLKESSQAVAGLIQSFEENDCAAAISSLTENRKVLKQLGKAAAISIETTRLMDLCDTAESFGSGKSSGAGGGDCGIAFLKGEAQMEELNKAWRSIGVQPIDMRISEMGAYVTEYDCEPSLKEYFVCV
ncbi:phosphomevalonate kinase [Neobacillus sp. MM2021_6]|uniref:phosphomevalonate kinase n=1 Tax=Bacillaceae TaxID=186817 RepID=UPI00140B39A9|nr:MULTISPECIES: phosphomevalonate kinase [Bacillaceae]MBO0961398.1 phosphomevalonate kinase [Neobacillus sp. MM2021_6]NHC20439.1 phosphomevalonate kinase [Bacillus sp. MM2020_4]